MKNTTFLGIRAEQSNRHTVVCVTASAREIEAIATIDRVGRDDSGTLKGFQRAKIANHIREIEDYLSKPDAVLPNPIVLAFTRGVEIEEKGDGTCKVTVTLADEPHGTVVDGQQRLSALLATGREDFRAFVSLLICESEEELRRQFILINNTRPLPKSLIYELLPSVNSLPERLGGRSFAASLVEKLNFDEASSLYRQIHMHTNPEGVIRDTALQKVIMNSASDGILREFLKDKDGEEKASRLISEYFRAVQFVFRDAWVGHTPKTSRLVHGAGIVAMGYVMELLAVARGSRDWECFARGLTPLIEQTAWTSGEWNFADGDMRHWKAVQNVNRDIMTLSHHLVGILRSAIRDTQKQNVVS